VKNFNPNKKIVIVGGGAAALSAIDSLRQNGYDGVITVISKEKRKYFIKIQIYHMIELYSVKEAMLLKHQEQLEIKSGLRKMVLNLLDKQLLLELIINIKRLILILIHSFMINY
jgi:hypothetical protein